MPKLASPQHETYARGMADGLRPIDAYERAGYVRSASAASQLKARPEIQQRVQELIQEKNDIAAANGDDIDNLPSDLNREWLIKTLMKNVVLAQNASQITPANKAVEMLAQLIGFSFKTPSANKDVDDDDKSGSKPEGLDMDALVAGLDKIGSITSKPVAEDE